MKVGDAYGNNTASYQIAPILVGEAFEGAAGSLESPVGNLVAGSPWEAAAVPGVSFSVLYVKEMSQVHQPYQGMEDQ